MRWRPDHYGCGRADDPLRRRGLARRVRPRNGVAGRIDEVGAEADEHDQDDEGCTHGGETIGAAEGSGPASTVLFGELPDRHAPDLTRLRPVGRTPLEHEAGGLDRPDPVPEIISVPQ